MADLNCPNPRAAYIHVPFCAHRCGYCDFTLVAGRGEEGESPGVRGMSMETLERTYGQHQPDHQESAGNAMETK